APRAAARPQGLRKSEATPELSLDQVHSPDRLDDPMDRPASHASVDLNDPGTTARGLRLDVQNARAEAECLGGLCTELHEAAHRASAVVGRAMEACLLERRLRGRPVLRDAREDALSVLEHHVDVELDA